jgi:vacuolar-type H+-ATPase subunit E/Vma4
MLAELLDGGTTSTIINVLALAAIFGSLFNYNRLKSALTASEATGKAWHEERDAALAAKERALEEVRRTEKEKLALVAKTTALEARPDLQGLSSAIETLASSATAQLVALTEATLQHETNAQERSVRIVAAIEKSAEAA